MSKKLGIIISLVATLVFGGLFMLNTQKELRVQTKKVEVYQANKFIPIGTNIAENDVKKIEVPEKMAENLINDYKYFEGKITTQNIGKDQYIFKNSMESGTPIKPGYVEVFIPTDLSKSAMAMPGELVDLYPIGNKSEGQILPPIYENARVIHSLDQEGKDIDPSSGEALKEIAASGDKVPVSIGVELPKDKVSMVVLYASNKNIYLVKNSQ